MSNLNRLYELIVKPVWRNVLRQPGRSLLVVSAAFFGSLGILFMLATINAFFYSMVHLTIDAGIGHVQLRPAGYARSRQNGLFLSSAGMPALQARFSALDPGVHYAPRLEREGLLQSGSASQGVQLIGIDPERENRVSIFHEWVQQGSLLDERQLQANAPLYRFGIPLVIGRENARKLEVDPGDSLVVSITDERGNFKSKRAIVAGIFASPSLDMDKSIALVRQQDLSQLYNRTDTLLSYLVFRTVSLDDAARLKSSLQKAVKGNNNVEVLSFKELEPGIVQIFDMANQFRFIAHFIMLIGFVLILFDSVSMSVFDRIREIGVIRAIGGKRAHLFGMVLLEALLLSAGGALLGIVAGSALCAWFYFSGLDLGSMASGLATMGMGSVIYPYLTLGDILETLGVTALVSGLAAIYPGVKAVRIQPVRAIYNR
ncbi:MAG: ABC transporter permease [Leptospiraceae bacterium]|nr:ABC transporter permease [Leptospiraceae bacterium]